MVDTGIEGVDYMCVNTDIQALKKMDVRTTMQIGASITKGLGAGADPGIGRQAALEDRERLQEMIEGTNMLFVTAGMGGGTGTGAAPVIAQIAKEMGILTVAVVTKPFGFERTKRMSQADAGIKELSSVVDSLITIPNDKLMPVLGKQTSLLEVFEKANDVLGVLRISEEGIDAELQDMLDAREAARDGRDWGESDRLRDELLARGIVVQDTPEGMLWRRA